MGQLFFGILCLLFSSIMLVASKSWEKLTERDLKVGVKLGLFSEKTAEKIHRFENSLLFKLFFFAMSLFFTGVGIYEVM